MSCAAYEAVQMRKPDGPKAGFWTEAGCTGDLLELDAGDYPNLSYFKIAGKPMVNRIKSAWIPPTMNATVFAYWGCQGSAACSGAAMWDYGKGYADMGPGQHPTISNAVGPNNIDAIKLTTTRTRDEFLDACCRGVPGNGVSPETCGDFWRPKSEQGAGACDFRVQEYCRVNPADPFCACYGSNLTTLSNLQGECRQVAPKCYSSACTSGNAYRPSSQLKDVCIPCKVCKQNVSVTGNSNMFNDNVILMDCSGGDAAPPGPQPVPTVSPGNTQSGNTTGFGTADQAAQILAAKKAADAASSARQMQIILVVIAVVVCAIWFGWGRGRAAPQAYQPQAYPQQAYPAQPAYPQQAYPQPNMYSAPL